MPITPQDVFNFSIELSKTALTNEVSRRIIISRLYYACYYKCLSLSLKDQMLSKNLNQKGGDHATLAKNYLKYQNSNNPYAPKIRKIGRLLGALRISRNNADYFIENTITIDETKDAIRDAKDIFHLIDHSLLNYYI